MGMDRMRPEDPQKAEPLLQRFLKDESSNAKLPSTDEMVAGLRTVLAAAAIYTTATPAEASPVSVRISPRAEQSAGTEKYPKEDIEILAENIFHEAKGESPEGQLGVMQVTLARLASGKFGKDLHQVILTKNQFSWTREALKPHPPEIVQALSTLRSVLTTFMKNKEPSIIVDELSKITNIPTNALYYKRTDWNENDPRETRMSDKTKAMFRSLVKVATVGQHTFYADPPKEEKVPSTKRVAGNR